jgi:hypothetical protein
MNISNVSNVKLYTFIERCAKYDNNTVGEIIAIFGFLLRVSIKFRRRS